MPKRWGAELLHGRAQLPAQNFKGALDTRVAVR
jgi:hypothetical protein